MKNIDTFKYIRVKRQKLSFIDSRYQAKIIREIIYPCNESQNSINKYFLDSISSDTTICVGSFEECFCFLKNTDHTSMKYTHSKIDNYWVDGETYLIDYVSDNTPLIMLVAIDRELNKEDIFAKLKEKVIGNNVLFIDQLSNCWIKRKGA